jgi:predicted AlkP superfamily pyrophosphatase or phosphodiesterase
MSSEFTRPRYDESGFASLPQRIAGLLASGRYRAVVLFLIDGFGWRFLDRFQGEPFLLQAGREGRVAKLSSQFPSTTAAHLTTIHTGMPVGEHGIFEWIYYEPDLDAVIAPLLFSFAGTPLRDTLKPAGVKPRRLYPARTLYRDLKKRGVSTVIFQHREYTPSTYSEAVFAGAKARGYRTLPEALVNLAEAIARTDSTSYFFLYYDRVDALCHEYGPESPQVEAEILATLAAMQSFRQRDIPGSAGRTLCLLTADHGQSEVDPATTIYLNRDARFEGLQKFLRLDGQGRPLVPAGSPRDFFLYIRAGLVEETLAFLAPRLEGRAEVRRVADLADEGFFGPLVSPAFRRRAGDLVILSYRGESVWWYEKDRFEQRYYGHHGGLTPLEMEIPLVSWEL